MQGLQESIQVNEVILEDNRYFKKKGYYIIKRFIDIIGALCGIILLSPIMIITAIAIKIDSRGPVFFIQNRLGLDGEIIKMFKFRTMITNAEELLDKLTPNQKQEFEVNFKLEHDLRVTKLGNALRKSSIDELPQLFNILIGNMSLVGPRPIVLKEIEKYGEYGYKLLTIKPGLTGKWQVSGRSNTTYEERVKLDMDYIDTRSLCTDIVIILKTVGVVLKKQGAI